MQTSHPRWVNAILGYGFIANSIPGLWALFIPHDFYAHFPGFGHAWVSVDGPYNEHLIRDVGAFFLAMSVLCLLAFVRPRLVAPRAVALCLLAFAIPHLIYHLNHLHMLPPVDQIGNVVALSLGVMVLIPLLFYRPTELPEPLLPHNTTSHHE
ncbi:hypothetical protein WBJ53_26600 [Spirosoma sp. SC4-14]|uniref:hypothetical protein n=1 Tax=Spirosoma sp. SC4-14 TaxID=3128900 RepID=UPI0030CD1A4D